MVFTGTYEHAIDAKNRLAIPAELRSRLRERSERRADDESIPVFVTLGSDRSLHLYAEPDFGRIAEDLRHSDMDPEELEAFERVMFSLSQRVEVDRQGRVRLPENLLSRTGLGGEVVVIGNNDHMEVHDRAAWQAFLSASLEKQSQTLMSLRRASRSRPGQG